MQNEVFSLNLVLKYRRLS